MEAKMPVRMRFVFLLLVLSFAALAIAGNKKKSTLPAYVLKAHNVVVLIDPNTGISVTSPLANKTAQEDVEKALMNWGRLNPVLDTTACDLVITVRKGSGKIVNQTIGGVNTNDRPVIAQQTDHSIRIGGQQGRAPGVNQPAPQDTNPGPQTEIGPSEDMFVVYEGPLTGGMPLEQRTPVWTFSAKNALRSPDVPAVAEFRKAIEEADKQQQQQKTKP
jgi:hypothetical protein